MENAVKGLIDEMIQNNIIQEEKKELYIYSGVVLVEKILSFVIVMLLGVLLGKLVDSVLFALFFICLRRYTGGYHSSSSFFCLVESVIVLFVILEFGPFLLTYPYVLIGLLIVSILIITTIGTVNHPNMNLRDKEIEATRKVARWTLFVEIVILIICYYCRISRTYILDMSLGIITCAASIILAKSIKQEVYKT